MFYVMNARLSSWSVIVLNFDPSSNQIMQLLITHLLLIWGEYKSN